MYVLLHCRCNLTLAYSRGGSAKHVTRFRLSHREEGVSRS